MKKNEHEHFGGCQECKEKDKEIERLKTIIEHYEGLLGFKKPDESKKLNSGFNHLT